MSETSSMSSSSELLKDVRVASPCAAAWDEMSGSDQVRSCAQCARKVYNLSAMSAADAADLMRKAEGKLCVRFYRRSDGTIMTRDCPVGLRAVRQRIARASSAVFASLFVWCGLSLAGKPRAEQPLLVRLLLDRFAPEPEAEPRVLVPLTMAPLPVAEPPQVLNAPPPPAERYTMGEMAPLPSPAAGYETGRASLPSLEASGDKPFLSGTSVDNDPRPDPFARQPKPNAR